MSPQEFLDQVLCSKLTELELLNLYDILDGEDTDLYELLGARLALRFPELFNPEPPYEYELMTEKS